MGQITQGLLMMIGGFLILVFRPKIKDLTGAIDFAERWFGPGGTWTFLVMVGVGLFIFGLMWATGSLQSFLLKTFGTLI